MMMEKFFFDKQNAAFYTHSDGGKGDSIHTHIFCFQMGRNSLYLYDRQYECALRELALICPLLLSPHELLIMCKHLTYHHIITKLSHDIVITENFCPLCQNIIIILIVIKHVIQPCLHTYFV